ncbi:transposase [Nonomuraea basaltis]|uniref:transposase n=1 Tax=Nonomuraea basaltis TaxID=2495887 RepID=UPI00110C6127|nr:transposase [Nonomuraea basaltis]TMR92608.1 transposase [Nonomuraea basaltis]
MNVGYGPSGIEVEVIVLDQCQRFRITQTVRGRRYLLAYCSRIQEVAQHVNLADLCEVIDFPSKRDSPLTA